VARAIYGRLPDDALLWLRRREFVAPDRPLIDVALAMTGKTGRIGPGND
jgi:hypothetical protein